MSMFGCPRCQSPSGVMQTRLDMRRRQCKKCRYVFYTEELVVERPPPGVKSKFAVRDGERKKVWKEAKENSHGI